MTVLAAILPFVSRSTSITHGLYRHAAATKTANHALNTARAINGLALMVKQVGTVVKEDDQIPSAEALETLEDVLDQCTALLSEIERIFPDLVDFQESSKEYTEHDASLPLDAQAEARLQYLLSHLASLRATLAVMLQTLNTAQSLMWARVRPTVSPAQCAIAVENERQQLKALIIEQQMAIVLASKLYEVSRQGAKLLMEQDSSQSLALVDQGLLQPASLFKYQDRFLETLDIHDSSEEEWLPTVCSISKSQLERLLDRWSRLRQFEARLQDEERKARAQKRESQQPSVESDSENDDSSVASSQIPLGPGSAQPLFAETQTLPIPIINGHRPASPISPASSFERSSASWTGNYLPIPVNPVTAPTSPRSSIGTLPMEAAARIEVKDTDDDVDLGIPWILRTTYRDHYWKYVDSKIQDTNSDTRPPKNLLDEHCWVEILASWVCKEAIQEAGYKFKHIQKEVPEGRRTKLEAGFRIEHALTFKQIEQLVERTVDIYRKTQGPSPPPHKPPTNPRRSTIERHPGLPMPPYDRNRTPVPNTHAYPPPPPPLDRSVSMPGPIPRHTETPRASTLNISISPPTNPQHQKHHAPPPPPIYTSSAPSHTIPLNPKLSPYRPSYPPPAQPLSPRPSSASRYTNQTHRYAYSSSPSTSDSDANSTRQRQRRRSRRRDDGERRARGGGRRERERERERGKQKKDGFGGGGAATKAMMGVAGLTALLDGLVGI